MTLYHEPVLREKVIEVLNIKHDGVYVDATFGGGGHAMAILEKLEDGKLIAFDQDKDAVANVPDDDRLVFFNHNFRYLKNFLALYDMIPVDGLFADLGVSSHQFEIAERGFSTRYQGPIDMRMNRASEFSAYDIINGYDEQELNRIFKFYGEIKFSAVLVREIVKERNSKKIGSTGDLVKIVEPFVPRRMRNKILAQVFQALRIEVNDELNALKEMLQQSMDVIKSGGRLVIISYHSLEDRIVKHFMRSGNFEGEVQKDFYGNKIAPFRPIGKMIIPSEKEVSLNSRARSAKLRIAEKI